jgi:hypothetical protein
MADPREEVVEAVAWAMANSAGPEGSVEWAVAVDWTKLARVAIVVLDAARSTQPPDQEVCPTCEGEREVMDDSQGYAGDQKVEEWILCPDCAEDAARSTPPDRAEAALAQEREKNAELRGALTETHEALAQVCSPYSDRMHSIVRSAAEHARAALAPSSGDGD